MIGITILGATGSIGINTLEVIKLHRQQYEVVALTAHSDVERLVALCLEWSPRYAVMVQEPAAEQVRQRLKGTHSTTEVLSGTEALVQVAKLPEISVVMAAIVGSAGLLPTLAAAQAGKRVLLANKEALVMSGQLFMEAIQQTGAELLPIDSEHNAVFQCMPHHSSLPLQKEPGKGLSSELTLENIGINRIILTASGGPFRDIPVAQLEFVTPEQACAHPNWKMGRKISVDSATMMNKGLEVIEACWLFSTTPNHVEVMLHPQSIIHSLVEYVDGSMLAQLGNPDMRTPIAHALAWPTRMVSGVTRLNLAQVGQLSFFAADFSRFPCLQLAYEAMAVGGTTTTILNAANEIAVHAFLEQQLPFTSIPRVIENTLAGMNGRQVTDIEVILEDDAHARHLAREIVLREMQTRK